MDYLWSPWRYRYLTGVEKSDGCVFCRIAAEDDDERHLIVFRGELNFVVLNRFPYTSGHLMVVPYLHASTLSGVDAATCSEMMTLVRASEGHLRNTYRPDGLNLGMNIGQSAGAGIAGHIHMHVLPRWHGDANFMTTVGETRVLPEELDVTWKRLRAAFIPE
ncbi:MAG TPA: HIT domain-containing protein [Bryobacteraceae bacterium]|nr:HIT domain-containing protein [Bryobacteraceae bacterium]